MLLDPYRFGVPSALLTGLISYWKLDEASGDALDAHGTNHLTDTNTVGTGAGKIGNSRDFERDTVEYFTRLSGASLSTGDIDFTIAAWVKIESQVTEMTIAGKFPSGNAEFLFCVDNNPSFPRLYVWGSGGQVLHQHGTALSVGVWHHVIAWHDSVNNQLGIALNNGTPSVTAHSAGVIARPTAPFIIGSDGNNGRLMDGTVDEVGFWKRVLTPVERSLIYQNGNGLTYPFALDPPPAIGHRYWRITSIVTAASNLEITELRVFENAVDVTLSATITSSSAPTSQALSRLFDGSLTTNAQWSPVPGTLYIQFVFTGGREINGVKQGGFDNSTRHMQGFDLQYSDDFGTWTTLGTKSGLTYPGNNTLSAIYTFP